MRNLLSAYFVYMKDPHAGLAKIFAPRSYGLAVLGYLAAAVSGVCLFNIGTGLGVFSFLLKTSILFCTEILLGLLMAACAALCLDFAGKKSSPAELFILIGTAGFMKGLLIAFAVIALAFPWLRFILPLGVLATLIFQLVYLMGNIQREYAASGWQSFFAIFFCVVPAAASLALAGIFFMWSLVLIF